MQAAVIAIVIVIASVAPAAASPGQDLERAIQTYKSGDWQSAAPVFNFLLYPPPGKLASASDLAQAHLLLGMCHFHLGRRDEAKTEFEAVLALQPDKLLEPPFFKPDEIRLFDETRTDVAERRLRDAKLRELEDQKRRLKEYLDTIGVYETHSYGVNYLPFGAGQFQNKQTTKAYALAGAQAASVGTSVGIFLYLSGKYGFVAKVPRQDGPFVLRLQQLEVGSGLVFFGLYAYGVIDALVHYQPSTRVQGDNSKLPDDLLGPKPAQPAKTKPKKTSFRDRLHIGPMWTPSGVGIGLGWEN